MHLPWSHERAWLRSHWWLYCALLIVLLFALRALNCHEHNMGALTWFNAKCLKEHPPPSLPAWWDTTPCHCEYNGVSCIVCHVEMVLSVSLPAAPWMELWTFHLLSYLSVCVCLTVVTVALSVGQTLCAGAEEVRWLFSYLWILHLCSLTGFSTNLDHFLYS